MRRLMIVEGKSDDTGRQGVGRLGFVDSRAVESESYAQESHYAGYVLWLQAPMRVI